MVITAAMSELKDLITQAEAARLKGVSQEWIRNLVVRGRLRATEIGGRRFVSRKEVLSYEPGAPGRPPVNADSTPKPAATRKKGAKTR
jgi:excisionase family DNA binding protein